MPTRDMWCHNVTSYGKVDWRSSQRQHPAGSRVPRCPSQADAAARRAKSTRSRHFKPLATSSEPICVAKPQVKALRILVYSPKRKASAYFAYFLLASPSCGKRCATVCRQVAPETHFLSMYLLLIPAQTRCKGASDGDAANSPALARCINLRGRAMLAPTCTCKAAYRAAASPIRRSQQKSLSMRSFAIDGGLR